MEIEEINEQWRKKDTKLIRSIIEQRMMEVRWTCNSDSTKQKFDKNVFEIVAWLTIWLDDLWGFTSIELVHFLKISVVHSPID